MQKRVDPVTLEVIYHRLTSIAEEMQNALLKSAFSTIVKEARDSASAVFDAQGQTIAQACSIAIHLGSLMNSVPQILKAFPASQMREGDVLILNDPYGGGTHMNDFTVVVPIIYQGEVVALACSEAHHQDIGGKDAGSTSPDATEIYQEGLNLPPVKFYDAGQPVEAIHNIIRNNVRIPDIVLGDLKAQVAAGNVGKLRVLELFEECGRDVVLVAMKQLLDHAETLTRRELEKIPDGSYPFVDYMDNDGIDIERRIKIQATLTIKGSEFIVDLSGSDPQVRGPINCVASGPLTAAAYVIRCITGASIPNNNGCFRPITLKLPEGSLVNAQRPAPLGSRHSTILRIADILLGALVKAIPERIPAACSGLVLVVVMGGVNPRTDRAFVTHEMTTGGSGACPIKDGVDAVFMDLANALSIPVEALEMGFPIRVWKRALYDGSGGAGEYRGGLGVKEVFEVLEGRVSTSFRGERFYTRPWGLFGGLSGASGQAFVVRQTGEKEEIPSKQMLTLYGGDRIHFVTPGGGGYGDPLKRKPERVLRDVRDKRISPQEAANDYGVVIDRESMTIDLEKTNQLREKLKRQRGPITWTYDRGPEGGRE